MAKRLPITPTLLNTYLTCPRQYKAKYITKEVPFKETKHTRFGNEVHAAVEHALKGQAELPPSAQGMKPLVDFCRSLAGKPNVDMFVEESLAINHKFEATTWRGTKSDPAWQRGKADVLFIDHDKKLNIIVDWKTGKAKDDKTQAHILSLCASKKSGYTKNLCLWAFVTKDTLIFDDIDLIDLSPIGDHLKNVSRYEQACDADAFEPTPCGLCNEWCEVVACHHNGSYEGAVK